MNEKSNIAAIAWGTKKGAQVFFSTSTSLLREPTIKNALADARTITNHLTRPLMDVHSIRFLETKVVTETYKVFTQYRSVRDWDGRPGFLAVSLFVPKTSRLSSISEALSSLMEVYEAHYMNGTRIAAIRENPELFKDVISKFTVSDIVTDSWTYLIAKKWPSSPLKGKTAKVIYENNRDLDKFFNTPFRPQYLEHEEIVFVEKDTQNKCRFGNLTPLNIPAEYEESFNLNIQCYVKKGGEKKQLADDEYNIKFSKNNKQVSDKAVIREVKENDKVEVLIKKEGFIPVKISAHKINNNIKDHIQKSYTQKSYTERVIIKKCLEEITYTLTITCKDANNNKVISKVQCTITEKKSTGKKLFKKKKETESNGTVQFTGLALADYSIQLSHKDYTNPKEPYLLSNKELQKESTVLKDGSKKLEKTLELKKKFSPSPQLSNTSSYKSGDVVTLDGRKGAAFPNTADNTGKRLDRSPEPKYLLLMMGIIIILFIGGYLIFDFISKGEKQRSTETKDKSSDNNTERDETTEKKDSLINQLNSIQAFANGYYGENLDIIKFNQHEKFIEGLTDKDSALLKEEIFKGLLHKANTMKLNLDSVLIVIDERFSLMKDVHDFIPIPKIEADKKNNLCREIRCQWHEYKLSTTQNGSIKALLQKECGNYSSKDGCG